MFKVNFSVSKIINGMIDFNQMVRNILWESPTPPPTSGGASSGVFEQYYKSTSELSPVRDYLTKAFRLNTWPSYSPIVPLTIDCQKRPAAVSLEPFATKFPLIDFIIFVIIQTGDINLIKPIDKTVMDQICLDFVAQSKGATGWDGSSVLDPVFNYIPVTPTGSTTIGRLRRKLSVNAIGTLSLKQFDLFSIKKTLYGLLETRKKIRKSTLNFDKLPAEIKFIDEMLTNPGKYTGKLQIPKELISLYDNVTAHTILTIALAMHNFANSEFERLVLDDPTLKGSKPIENYFTSFISNEPLTNSKFNFVFIDPAGFVRGTGPSNPPIVAEPFPGKGGYTIQNIKNIDSPESKKLIEELEYFANYVSEGEPKNYLGKFTQAASDVDAAAKGARLGAQVMGT